MHGKMKKIAAGAAMVLLTLTAAAPAVMDEIFEAIKARDTERAIRLISTEPLLHVEALDQGVRHRCTGQHCTACRT